MSRLIKASSRIEASVVLSSRSSTAEAVTARSPSVFPAAKETTVSSVSALTTTPLPGAETSAAPMKASTLRVKSVAAREAPIPAVAPPAAAPATTPTSVTRAASTVRVSSVATVDPSARKDRTSSLASTKLTEPATPTLGCAVPATTSRPPPPLTSPTATEVVKFSSTVRSVAVKFPLPSFSRKRSF